MSDYGIIQAVRTAIGDDDPKDERFDYDQIVALISGALKRLARRILLNITITNGALSREPTSTESDLIVIQTQCNIAKRELYNASRKGARIRQDESSVDTAAGLSVLKEAVNGEGGVCTELEAAIAEYLEENPIETTSVAGTYGENIWQGNKKLYEDVDHDGQGFERIYTPRKQAHQRKESSGGDGHVFDEDRFTTD